MDVALKMHRWLASTWRASRDPIPETVVPASGSELAVIRQAMRMALASCSNEHRARATGQIARAGSEVELWLLRSSLYQYLAQDLGQGEANRRVDSLLPLFSDAIPGAARARQIAHNERHEQCLH